MVYLARKGQKLYTHLKNTACLARHFAEVFGFGATAHYAGMLHDFGKYTYTYQDYLIRRIKGEGARRGEVIHAFQGVKYALDTLRDPLVSDIIGSTILAHHGGLSDTITNAERTLLKKINDREIDINYGEALEAFVNEIGDGEKEGWSLSGCPPKLTEEIEKEVLGFCNVCANKNLNLHFMLHLATKVLFSCLVDADRCDAAGIKPDDTAPDWAHLADLLESHLAGFFAVTPLDKIRGEISQQCTKAGKRIQGTYTLSVPTGGGKTLSSLRFAIEHAKEHNLKRIIYVIPYLSILDQTALQLWEVFKEEDDSLILEHHSNIELPEKDDENELRRLLVSRWDSPIIMTTMVQFLETIYSNKASMLRKFHNMSEAVLVFDEIQSLPVKCTHLFNDAINFLSTFGKSTALLCTATQPHLDKMERPIHLSECPTLVQIPDENKKVFNRVYIKNKAQEQMSHKQIADLAKEQLDVGKSTLVIMNTKKDALAVYSHCDFSKPDVDKAFLTTDLCPEHRLAVLERLRCNLENKRLTLCVSTQLIEAGVDISFGCVIRANAGLDSIVQAAGRCNRNNEIPETPQSVFIIDVMNENISQLPDIEEGKRETLRILREVPESDLLSEDTMALFYKYISYRRKDKMDYNIDKGNYSIYNCLSNNPLDIQAYKDRHCAESYIGLPAAFETAARAFAVIDKGQSGIVVPYGDAMELVCEFGKSFDPTQKTRLLKHLQRYTVNVYPHTLEKLRGSGAIAAVEDAFYLLSPDWYNNDQGLLSDSQLTLLYMSGDK